MGLQAGSPTNAAGRPVLPTSPTVPRRLMEGTRWRAGKWSASLRAPLPCGITQQILTNRMVVSAPRLWRNLVSHKGRTVNRSISAHHETVRHCEEIVSNTG